MTNRKSNRNNAPRRVLLRGSQPSMSKFEVAAPRRAAASTAGAEWLRKYLNPNGELAAKTTSGKIPDGTCKRSGCFNIHKYLVLNRPVQSNDGSSTWSLFAISTNTMFVSHIFVADLNGSSSISEKDMGLITYKINTWYSDDKFNTWIRVLDHLYIYLQVDSAFENYCFYNTGHEPKHDFIKMRQTYKGDTFRFTGSTLENEGQVCAAKFTTNFDIFSLPLVIKPATSNVDQVDHRLLNDAIPVEVRRDLRADLQVRAVERFNLIDAPQLDVSYLTESDPAAYSGRASQGVYSVNYNTKDDFAWHTMGDHRLIHITPSFSEVLDVLESDGNYCDIVCPLWDVGVVAFIGISNTATIQIESRRGLEFVSAVGGKYANLQADSAIFDPYPVQVAKAVAMTLKSGYPAAYNDWGKLWSTIKQVLPSVVGMIPGVGPILSGIANPAIELIEGLITGKRQGTGETIGINPTNNTPPGRRPGRR